MLRNYARGYREERELVAAMESMSNKGGRFKYDVADGVAKLKTMQSKLSDGWFYLGA
jgi:hypothetical protein